MQARIIGISGSPIKNSNTDRLIQAILGSSGLNSEFIKLSKMNVKPCIACLGCKKDNICKVKDDFPELAEKIRRAEAIVVGGYAPYGSVDGFTKAFLERLFSLRHQNGLNRGKFAVVVASGIGRGAPGLEETGQQIEHALTVDGMEILGNLKITGNTECLVCGFGSTCPMSSLPWVFGDDIEVTPDKFCKVEDQSDVWERANELGLEIAEKIKNRALM
ncbi:flavodoxin family protein [Desulfobacter hydrogenophilus]|uniref:Flavodoxin family protein n=1 Tax=Desulfobacter hydrogenophilus TaxID=2291 RepID=A0A328FKW9_9BACT|nr:flavodoxin family protein [Desulfobacter hydrogenophilus]NDY72270.1 flavodoxin family protein [Desulfobacter hydrogenophilus]QBH12898.1 flavodoxin family protein [Desulfobacter hydrogenophilus]RAM03883.1 flavodoxin family protein [Desulfobacter hydrogenophilus]